MSMFEDVKFSYVKAHEILWKLGYWRYLLIPIALSVVLAFVLVGFCFLFSAVLSSLAHEYLSGLFEMPEWFRIIILILIFGLGLGPCYVLFRGLVMVCYGPFLDKLSIKAEALINGKVKDFESGFFDSIKRPLQMAFYTISASIAFFFGGLALGLIPLLGMFVAGITLLVQMYLSAVPYVDPYMERSGYSARESFRLMRKHTGSVLLFGLIGLLTTAIPIVGWFIGPTYSVVAGIILGILLTEGRPEGAVADQK
ncbi:EI24 domain-containing protein [Rubellicoccus peritrichatus]|uniref:EI24 domain-containing protein n=1 Tax=Rubellicoccus peritrichatus TaxID=3080537 RepID=A0AAQ3QUU8_9BACT|nr:EI24 domain-containing protein [Puniceicoccus sp. CR14]WOO42796.1 EI24 domain-containing protein [Puniceicoccus sp. CR14]